MNLSDSDRTFLETNHSAAMITIGEDGMPKPARCGVGLVDGRLWSSGTRGRKRTDRLRKDPRSTLFVFAEGFAWLGLEARVHILDGPDAPQLNLRFFRMIQHKPTGPLSWFDGEFEEEAFLQTMVDEGRLLYEFEITKAYGMH